jgi:hypothetical protein
MAGPAHAPAPSSFAARNSLPCAPFADDHPHLPAMPPHSRLRAHAGTPALLLLLFAIAACDGARGDAAANGAGRTGGATAAAAAASGPARTPVPRDAMLRTGVTHVLAGGEVVRPQPAPAPAADTGDTAAGPAPIPRGVAGDSARHWEKWAARRVPAPAPGSLIPGHRIVAFYGNPLSSRMGILGELPPQEMLARLERQAKEWEQADPSMPVVKALEVIGVVAQGDSGRDGRFRLRMDSSLIEKVYGWAQEANAQLIIDIQVGRSTPQDEIRWLERFLKRPDVHLAIDPEFDMRRAGVAPGRKVGTTDAADINWAIDYLADLVRKHNLPPKFLVVHRFTRNMLTNSAGIRPDPLVPVIVQMDGWGAAWLKRATYRQYILTEPVQYTGFKIFYHNDTKKGDPLMKPRDVLQLFPKPVFIQYQ